MSSTSTQQLPEPLLYFFYERATLLNVFSLDTLLSTEMLKSVNYMQVTHWEPGSRFHIIYVIKNLVSGALKYQKIFVYKLPSDKNLI